MPCPPGTSSRAVFVTYMKNLRLRRANALSRSSATYVSVKQEPRYDGMMETRPVNF